MQENSPPVASVCVLTAPSCSAQPTGHRQPWERGTNCVGHQGYAASLSLSASPVVDVVFWSYRVPTYDITVYIAITNKYCAPLFEYGDVKCIAAVKGNP